MFPEAHPWRTVAGSIPPRRVPLYSSSMDSTAAGERAPICDETLEIAPRDRGPRWLRSHSASSGRRPTHEGQRAPARCPSYGYRPSPLVAGVGADPRFGVRDGSQVLVDRLEVLVGEVAVDRPRHHLEDLGGVVGILARAQRVDELLEREAGGTALHVRREIRRRERAEVNAARQVVDGIDLLGLAHVGIVTGSIRRARVTVRARAARVHEIAAEPDEIPLPVVEVELHRSDLETSLDSAVILQRMVIIIVVVTVPSPVVMVIRRDEAGGDAERESSEE